MTKVFETKLESSEKFILLAMSDYASDDGESVYPSVESLSRKTSLSERTVQRSIQTLMEMGWITMVDEGGGRSNTNLYRINQEQFVYLPPKKKKARYVKGDTTPIKGDTQSIKGDTVSINDATMAPEPLLSVSNPLVNRHMSAKNADIPEPVYEEFNNQADMPQSFVDEYKPAKPPKKSKSDPRYLHIAYSAFFSITSRRPNRELVDTIIELIGDTPDTDKLRACYKEWLMRGYNQNSIKWLEWYRDGIPGIKRNEVKSFRPTEENDPYFDAVRR